MIKFGTCALLLLVMCSLLIAAQTSLDVDFQNGMKFYEETRFVEAAEAFKRSVKKHPDNPEAFYYLGNSYFQMHQDKEAVKAYNRTIELKPDYFLAYNNLGTAYHRLGEFRKAIVEYEKALRVQPNAPEAIFGLGVVYLELKDRDSALEQHKRLAAIDLDRADKLYNYINNKITLNVINGKAISLPKPVYPGPARAAHAYGVVVVWVSVDETGKVISASAVTGHPLLRPVSVEAAKLARFSPVILNGKPIRVTGLITYNFEQTSPRPVN